MFVFVCGVYNNDMSDASTTSYLTHCIFWEPLYISPRALFFSFINYSIFPHKPIISGTSTFVNVACFLADVEIAVGICF